MRFADLYKILSTEETKEIKENPEVSPALAGEEFTPDEIKVIQSIELGVIYGNIAGKTLEQWVTILKEKAGRLGQGRVLELKMVFMRGVAQRFFDKDKTSVFTLYNWANIRLKNHTLIAETVVTYIFSDIFRLDEFHEKDPQKYNEKRIKMDKLQEIADRIILDYKFSEDTVYLCRI